MALLLLVTKVPQGYGVYTWEGSRDRSVRYGPHGFGRSLRDVSDAVVDALALDVVDPETGEGEAPPPTSSDLSDIQSAVESGQDALVKFDPKTRRYDVSSLGTKMSSSDQMRRWAVEIANDDPSLAFDLIQAASGPLRIRVAVRHLLSRSYSEYVEEKKRKGEKPMPKDKWESRQKGKGQGGKDPIEEGLKGKSKQERKKILERALNTLDKEDKAQRKKFIEKSEQRGREKGKDKAVMDKLLKGLSPEKRKRVLERALRMSG